MNKILKLILHPEIIRKKIEWAYYKKRFNNIGKNSSIGNDISIVGERYITIGNNFAAGKSISLWAWKTNEDKTPQIIIKDNVGINDFCAISCANKVEIGSGCLFGTNAFVTDNFHGKNDNLDELKISPIKREIFYKGEVIIGNNVWIGRNVCIMPNVKIGDGAIIGANSVVTHDIPEYCVAVGSPAKVVKRITDTKEK